MFKPRPRLRTFDYTGLYRYFLTFCTHQRMPHSRDAASVRVVLSEILRTAAEERVAILAHCFMPDHVHLVVEGRDVDTDVRRFVNRAKQRSGYEFSRRFGTKLWQPSWYDRVLRDDDETPRVVRYVVENPVRAGLVDAFEDYPFCGSEFYTREEIRGWIDDLEIWEP